MPLEPDQTLFHYRLVKRTNGNGGWCAAPRTPLSPGALAEEQDESVDDDGSLAHQSGSYSPSACLRERLGYSATLILLQGHSVGEISTTPETHWPGRPVRARIPRNRLREEARRR